MIGVDTSFLIDFFNGEEDAVKRMEEHKDVVHISENVVYEFMCGNLDNNEVEKFLGFVSHFPTVSFDRDSAIRSSEILRNQKRNGTRISHPDTMIAGSYLGHEVSKIVTGNTSDFENIQDLEVLEY
ncbi:MAG: hypothetical protein BRC29_02230 [Nanohaloarchaea archaeon SW_7_43_1]|nr:MAG: hypothetical protein BRC29_02230 [Nanohaloarchaea archaeon SW_7_43_1]